MTTQLNVVLWKRAPVGGGYVENKFYCFASIRFYVRVSSYNGEIYFSGTAGLYVQALIVSPYLFLYYLLPQNTAGKEKAFFIFVSVNCKVLCGRILLYPFD